MNKLPRGKPIEARDPEFSKLRNLVIIVWSLWAGITVVAVGLFELPGLMISLVLLSGLVVTLIMHLYHKRQIEDFLHYRQIEALLSVYSSLRIEQPLPPFRLWVISPDFAATLLRLIRQYRPELIVELGSGASTVISSYTLDSIGSGRIVSFEHLEAFARATVENLTRHSKTDRSQVIYAPLVTMQIREQKWSWYDPYVFDNLDNIDMLVIDGPPKDTNRLARYPALPLLFDKLSDNAIIVMDDFGRPDEYEVIERWLAEFNCELVEVIGTEKGTAILRKRGAAP